MSRKPLCPSKETNAPQDHFYQPLLIILKEKVHNSRSSSRNKLPQWVAQIVQVINFSTRKVDRQT
jgi:hypothetical protein